MLVLNITFENSINTHAAQLLVLHEQSTDYKLQHKCSNLLGKSEVCENKAQGLYQKAPSLIFTRSFGGFASPEKYAEEADALARTLRNRGQPFHEDFFYTAGYDSPFKLFNRHNEVWYFKK